MEEERQQQKSEILKKDRNLEKFTKKTSERARNLIYEKTYSKQTLLKKRELDLQKRKTLLKSYTITKENKNGSNYKDDNIYLKSSELLKIEKEEEKEISENDKVDGELEKKIIFKKEKECISNIEKKKSLIRERLARMKL